MFLALCWIAMVAQGEPGGNRLVNSPELSPARVHVQRFEALHAMLPTKLADTVDLVLSDVDGDGDPDLYVVSRIKSPPGYAGQQDLYLNDGTGIFTDGTLRLPENTRHTGAVGQGDVDGDGDPDLVLATVDGIDRQNRLYLNDGKGWFTDGSAQLPADSDTSYALALGDVDGDDDLDLWFANSGQDRLLLNDGLGSFIDATEQIPVSLVATDDVQLGDVDCDGDLDVVLARSQPCGSAQNQLYLNDGDGNFSDASHLLPVDSSPATAVELGDVDGDELLDILFFNSPDWSCDAYASHGSGLYLNDGAGAFTASAGLSSPSSYTGGVVLGDLDGDLDLDLWFGSSVRSFYDPDPLSPYPILAAGQQNRLYLNDGSGLFTEATDGLEQVLDASFAGAVGDVDGDGDPDLVVGNDGVNLLLFGDGQGELKAGALPMLPDGVPVCSVALGDVDRDGVLDAILGRGVPEVFPFVGEPVPDDNTLYLGDGAGGFVDASDRIPGSVYRAPQVALGDVDRDHDLDLLLAFAIDDEYIPPVPRDCQLLLNDGMGNYTDASDQLPWFGSDRGVTYMALLVDVNCDGAADIFLGSGRDRDGGGGGVDFFLNDGNGHFSDASSQVGLSWAAPRFIEAQDVNGDQVPDLIVGASRSENGPYNVPGASVLLNDRNGVFHDTGAQLPDDALFGQATALTLGDADGDGDRDLLFGWSDDTFGHRNLLYLNDGKGRFTESEDPVPPAVDEFRFTDVDGDGDQDLLGTTYLLENDGRGRFRDATSSMPANTGGIEAMALGDLDGDGDVDAVVARQVGAYRRLDPQGGAELIWSNLTRHVAWRGEPRLGQPLVLDVFGPGGEPWILLGSLATCDTVTSWGILHLDPASMFTAGQGILPPSSRADVTFQIPTLPAWLGLTVHWQALVGTPARLTNLENTTFSDL